MKEFYFVTILSLQLTAFYTVNKSQPNKTKKTIQLFSLQLYENMLYIKKKNKKPCNKT